MKVLELFALCAELWFKNELEKERLIFKIIKVLSEKEMEFQKVVTRPSSDPAPIRRCLAILSLGGGSEGVFSSESSPASRRRDDEPRTGLGRRE